jgi:hypothetical protein
MNESKFFENFFKTLDTFIDCLKDGHGEDEIDRSTAKRVGDELKIDWDRISLDEFHRGMNVELEHKDVTNGDLTMTGKIALAHLKERSNYYTLLAQIEQ